jgi:hypothetical protein
MFACLNIKTCVRVQCLVIKSKTPAAYVRCPVQQDVFGCTTINEGQGVWKLRFRWILERQIMFSGAFEKLRKATISFVMSVCPFVRLSVCPSVSLSAWKNSAPTGRILMIFETFSKICRENSNFIKIRQK